MKKKVFIVKVKILIEIELLIHQILILVIVLFSAVIIVAIVWMGYYHFVLKDQDKNTIESDGLDILDGQNKIKLFTADELRKYDGTGNILMLI